MSINSKMDAVFALSIDKCDLITTSPIVFNPTYYRPFGATSDIGGGTMYPPLLVMHVPLVLSQ